MREEQAGDFDGDERGLYTYGAYDNTSFPLQQEIAAPSDHYSCSHRRLSFQQSPQRQHPFSGSGADHDLLHQQSLYSYNPDAFPTDTRDSANINVLSPPSLVPPGPAALSGNLARFRLQSPVISSVHDPLVREPTITSSGAEYNLPGYQAWHRSPTRQIGHSQHPQTSQAYIDAEMYGLPLAYDMQSDGLKSDSSGSTYDGTKCAAPSSSSLVLARAASSVILRRRSRC